MSEIKVGDVVEVMDWRSHREYMYDAKVYSVSLGGYYVTRLGEDASQYQNRHFFEKDRIRLKNRFAVGDYVEFVHGKTRMSGQIKHIKPDTQHPYQINLIDRPAGVMPDWVILAEKDIVKLDYLPVGTPVYVLNADGEVTGEGVVNNVRHGYLLCYSVKKSNEVVASLEYDRVRVKRQDDKLQPGDEVEILSQPQVCVPQYVEFTGVIKKVTNVFYCYEVIGPAGFVSSYPACCVRLLRRSPNKFRCGDRVKSVTEGEGVVVSITNAAISVDFKGHTVVKLPTQLELVEVKTYAVGDKVMVTKLDQKTGVRYITGFGAVSQKTDKGLHVTDEKTSLGHFQAEELMPMNHAMKAEMDHFNGYFVAERVNWDGADLQLRIAVSQSYGDYTAWQVGHDLITGFAVITDPHKREINCYRSSGQMNKGIYKINTDGSITSAYVCDEANVKDRPSNFDGGKGIVVVTYKRHKLYNVGDKVINLLRWEEGVVKSVRGEQHVLYMVEHEGRSVELMEASTLPAGKWPKYKPGTEVTAKSAKALGKVKSLVGSALGSYYYNVDLLSGITLRCDEEDLELPTVAVFREGDKVQILSKSPVFDFRFVNKFGTVVSRSGPNCYLVKDDNDQGKVFADSELLAMTDGGMRVKGALAAMSGKWRVEQFNCEGVDHKGGMTVVQNGAEWWISEADGSRTAGFDLFHPAESSEQRGQIECYYTGGPYKGHVCLGVYKIEGDKATIVTGAPGGGRATDWTPGRGRRLVVLRKHPLQVGSKAITLSPLPYQQCVVLETPYGGNLDKYLVRLQDSRQAVLEEATLLPGTTMPKFKHGDKVQINDTNKKGHVYNAMMAGDELHYNINVVNHPTVKSASAKEADIVAVPEKIEAVYTVGDKVDMVARVGIPAVVKSIRIGIFDAYYTVERLDEAAPAVELTEDELRLTILHKVGDSVTVSTGWPGLKDRVGVIQSVKRPVPHKVTYDVRFDGVPSFPDADGVDRCKDKPIIMAFPQADVSRHDVKPKFKVNDKVTVDSPDHPSMKNLVGVVYKVDANVVPPTYMVTYDSRQIMLTVPEGVIRAVVQAETASVDSMLTEFTETVVAYDGRTLNIRESDLKQRMPAFKVGDTVMDIFNTKVTVQRSQHSEKGWMYDVRDSRGTLKIIHESALRAIPGTKFKQGDRVEVRFANMTDTALDGVVQDVAVNGDKASYHVKFSGGNQQPVGEQYITLKKDKFAKGDRVEVKLTTSGVHSDAVIQSTKSDGFYTVKFDQDGGIMDVEEKYIQPARSFEQLMKEFVYATHNVGGNAQPETQEGEDFSEAALKVIEMISLFHPLSVSHRAGAFLAVKLYMEVLNSDYDRQYIRQEIENALAGRRREFAGASLQIKVEKKKD